MKGGFIIAAAFAVAFALAPRVSVADVVERELGTNAAGETVTGYVFQAPRGSFRNKGSRRPNLNRDSQVLRVDEARRSRGHYRPARGLYVSDPGWYWRRHGCWTGGAALAACAPMIPAPFCGSVLLWYGAH